MKKRYKFSIMLIIIGLLFTAGFKLSIPLLKNKETVPIYEDVTNIESHKNKASFSKQIVSIFLKLIILLVLIGIFIKVIKEIYTKYGSDKLGIKEEKK